MAISDKTKWNERYKKRKYPSKVSQTLQKALLHVKGEQALDIACGMGRNTHFLVANGFCVDAVDISDYALLQLKKDACINPIEADLETYEIAKERYDLIVNANFLLRPLFAQIERGLRSGGVVAFETFINAEGTHYPEPMNPAYLLASGELQEAFATLETLHYEEYDATNLEGSPVRVASYIGRRR